MEDVFISRQRIFKRDNKVLIVFSFDLPKQSTVINKLNDSRTSEINNEKADKKSKNKKKYKANEKQNLNSFVAFYDKLYLQIVEFCENKLLESIYSKNSAGLYRLKLSLSVEHSDDKIALIKRVLSLYLFNKRIFEYTDEDTFVNGIIKDNKREKRIKRKSRAKKSPKA